MRLQKLEEPCLGLHAFFSWSTRVQAEFYKYEINRFYLCNDEKMIGVVVPPCYTDDSFISASGYMTVDTTVDSPYAIKDWLLEIAGTGLNTTILTPGNSTVWAQNGNGENPAPLSGFVASNVDLQVTVEKFLDIFGIISPDVPNAHDVTGWLIYNLSPLIINGYSTLEVIGLDSVGFGWFGVPQGEVLVFPFLEAVVDPDVVDAFTNLENQVIVLVDHHGQVNALVGKLHEALGFLESANVEGALDKLDAFINHVKAQMDKKIPKKNGETLIELTEALIEMIEGE